MKGGGERRVKRRLRNHAGGRGRTEGQGCVGGGGVQTKYKDKEIVALREEVYFPANNLSTRRKRQASMAEAAQGEEVGRRLKELEAGQAKLQDSMRMLTAKMDLILAKF
jgi:hypothetical protein